MKMQLDELQKKICQQGSIKDKLKESYNKKQEDFMVQAGEFVSNFGLSFNGKKIRETEASERLELLQKDEEILSKELQQLRNKQRESCDIEEEKSAIMEEVRAYRKRLKDLEAKLASAKTRTTEIYGEKQQLAKKPENGQEFKRLQQELGVCRRDSLEGLCQALQLELNRLQRQVWQKRIQRPMVAVPPTSLQQPPPTGIPKFMPQRKCNTYARYEMTKPTASNCVLKQRPSDGSKVTESGELDSKQLTPPPGLSSNKDKFHEEETDQKTEIANIAEEAAFLEEIFISDDELTTADDAEGKRAASDNR
ncbi:putative coiled-coil domain-containing protein [Apostichopus japonicus]|uniref:Coiled-coil domain-containing protein 172 n=1 Tax=Stichopus japonicus TaxID=307972 RepID=A0A2G8KN88_STIJA|nr:putative coiled-coil domain-containing protein [Apostichopus japonicus]